MPELRNSLPAGVRWLGSVARVPIKRGAEAIAILRRGDPSGRSSVRPRLTALTLDSSIEYPQSLDDAKCSRAIWKNIPLPGGKRNGRVFLRGTPRAVSWLDRAFSPGAEPGLLLIPDEAPNSTKDGQWRPQQRCQPGLATNKTGPMIFLSSSTVGLLWSAGK